MVQKLHPRGVIWVPNPHPQAGHLSEKKYDNLAVQYEDVHVLTNLGLGPGQLWLMGPLIFPCCVFSLAYYILTAPRLRNVDGFILPILQKVVKIYIHDICNFFIRLKGPNSWLF